jgi:hypothetical protein
MVDAIELAADHPRFRARTEVLVDDLGASGRVGADSTTAAEQVVAEINAGILLDKTFSKMSVDEFRLIVHLMAAFRCTKAV